jgi:hypothetical protein
MMTKKKYEPERRRLCGLLACKREELPMYLPGFFMRRKVESEIAEIQKWLTALNEKHSRPGVVFHVRK